MRAVDPVSPKSAQVLRELLAIGFRAYPRSLGNGLLFAALTVAGMWDDFPHSILVPWFASFIVLAVARLQIARAFMRAPVADGDLDRWATRAAIGYGAAGFAWGMLGTVALGLVPPQPVYTVWIGFLIALFAVLQSTTTGAHPRVFTAFVVCALGPPLVAALVLPALHYGLRVGAVVLLFGMAMLVGRSGNRYARESIAMRFENVELLEALRQQKDELARANVAKTRFLAAASHDLRQPMQAIALLVDSLHDRVQNPDNQRIVASIGTSVEAMSTLLNEILDISKLDAGVVTPRKTTFEISRVLERLRASFAEAAARGGLILRVRPCEAVVETDEVLLYRILANLTDNALRYTQRGGVLIGCRPRGDTLSVEIWDTGIGIPPDQHEEIFREFHQLANPQRDRAQGFGLGLAIVKRGARVLGLPLQMRSRVGRGSVFRLAVARGERRELTAAEPLAVQTLGCNVLVVEDDPDIGSALVLLLEGWGCRVALARSGAQIDEALGELRVPPDAIIADYRLPGSQTGLDVIDRVLGLHPGAHAMVLTGDVAPQTLRETQAAGYPVLHKPLRPARLRSLLAAAVRDREAAKPQAVS